MSVMLRRYSYVPKSEIAPVSRVFVNRSLMLEKVKFYGFDMDYTLAGMYGIRYVHCICVRM